MKSTDSLMQEHKLILRALDVLDAMRDLVEQGRHVEPADIDKIVGFLRWFGDEHHQAKEETILFPAFRSAAATQGRSVAHLMLEHHQERSLVEDMEKDLRLTQGAEFASHADRLSARLRNHIYKEDHILFEDAVLAPAEDDAVYAGFLDFDKAHDVHTLDQKLADLRSLEWKYVRK
jgi:hemerythrin-like domain-containing protein